MINTITLGPDPPPGRYSSGSRGILSATPAHPAAPSRDPPPPPPRAPYKKPPRVSARFGFSLTPGQPPQHRAKSELYQHFSWSARSGLRPPLVSTSARSALAGFARQQFSNVQKAEMLRRRRSRRADQLKC